MSKWRRYRRMTIFKNKREDAKKKWAGSWDEKINY